MYGKRGDSSQESRGAVEAKVKCRWRQMDLALTHDRIPMEDLLEFWLGQVKKSCKPSTHSNYRVLVEKIRPVLGEKYADEVSHGDVVALLATVGTPYQRNRVLMVLRAVFKLAIGLGKSKTDPTTLMKNSRVESKRRTALTEAEAAQLLASVKHDAWWHAALSVLLRSGLRRGELLALSWDMVDLVNSTIRIERNLTTLRGRKHIETPKTKNSVRTVPIGKTTIQTLVRLREVSKSDIVFADKYGDHTHPDAFTRRFKKIAKKAGFPDIDVHSLRTTAATIALKNGVSPETVARHLGHGSVAVLLDRYRTVSMGERRNLANEMERLVPEVGEKIVVFPGDWERKAVSK
jgi:integrase